MPFETEADRRAWAAYAAFVAAKFALASSLALDGTEAADQKAAEAVEQGIAALLEMGYEVSAK